MKAEELYNEEFDLMEIDGVEVLFTPLRLKRDIIPSHLYAYDIRSSDDGSNDFCTIETSVRVNHTGTIISKTPMLGNDENCVEIQDYGFFDQITLTQYLDESMTISKVVINDVTYRLFHLTIDGKHLCVAEEKLEKYIQKCIDEDAYHKVEWIDNQYGYYVSQDIADTENEEQIKQSVLDIIDVD